MADGGIHDQLGGGFCRYSVDAEWTIPHFEKMLYDNGPLLGLYADLARATGDARFADVARGIVDWMTREMRAPDGAFFSSLDADSEGEEGKFYVWTRDEVRSLLAPDVYAVAAPHYGLDGAPNFEGHAWNLRVSEALGDIAARLSIPRAEAAARLDAAKAALFAARAKRVRPGLDDKILTSWNALAIAGLARAARACDLPPWADLACAATDALRRTAWRDDRLLATRKGERAHLNAYLDDYAFLLQALLELMQTRFRAEDYAWARELADVLLDEFEDPEHGGFFFTSHDHERLFHRTKPGHDNATPSGNGVAAGALIVLGHLCGVPRYVEAGERALRLFSPVLARSPVGFRVDAGRARRSHAAAGVRPAGGKSRGVHRVAAHARAHLPSDGAHLQRRGRAIAGRARQRRRARRPGGGVGLSRHAVPSADRRIAGRRGRNRCVKSGSKAGRGSTPCGGRALGSGSRGGRSGSRVAIRRSFRYHSTRFPQILDGVAMKIAAVVLAAGLLATGAVRAADAGEELMKKDGCTACHAIDKKIVGPSYKEVAAKYRGNAGAAAMLFEKVKKGGQGVWGPVPMPPNATVSDADIKTLVAYILALK